MTINKNKLFDVLLVMSVVFLTIQVTVKGEENITNSSQINYYQKGYRYNIQGWVYVHIEGEAYERGYQYGYLAPAEIVDMINRWSDFGKSQVKIMNQFYAKSPNHYWEICKSLTMRRAWKQYPQELKEEIKGIADGIKDRGYTVHGHDVTFEDIVTLSEMQGCWYNFIHFFKQFHPLKNLVYGIKNLFSKKPSEDIEGFCSTFLATGDATTDGGIVALHSTQPIYNLDERFNFAVDIQPSEGNRFIMVGTPPGFIWGLTQFYINDKGIVLMESTLPQGPWKRQGIPIAVRARRAIQYSDSIDDVINILKTKNNGLYECEWMIGDSKTKEIATIELALFNTPVKRTKNGFYWSCNLAHDPKVKKELSGGLPPFILKRITNTFENEGNPRALKFMEVEKEYYGRIDLETAKEIITIDPLCKNSCDTKITDSNMMENLGLIAHMGVPNGTLFNPTEKQKKTYERITPLPASGWVDIYPFNSDPPILDNNKITKNEQKESKLLWQYPTDKLGNRNYSSNIISESTVYSATSSGNIYALDKTDGNKFWNINIGKSSLEPVLSGNLLFVCSENGLHAIDKETGRIKWEKTIEKVSSKPYIYDEKVIVGTSDGILCSIDKNSGDKNWNYIFDDKIYISNIKNSIIYIGSGKSCYSFNIKDQKVVWQYKTNGLITASPIATGNTVYLGSWDGNLYALDSTNGNLKWKYQTGWGIDSTPYVSDGTVYVGSLDNKFYAVSEDTGKLQWFFPCKAAIHSNPYVYGEYVFFGCDDGKLYALDKLNGDLIWSYAPGYYIKEDDSNNYLTTPILSGPVVKDGIVYLGAKGNIYALDAQTLESENNNSEKNKTNNDLILLAIYLLLFLLGLAMIIRTYLKLKNSK